MILRHNWRHKLRARKKREDLRRRKNMALINYIEINIEMNTIFNKLEMSSHVKYLNQMIKTQIHTKHLSYF